MFTFSFLVKPVAFVNATERIILVAMSAHSCGSFSKLSCGFGHARQILDIPKRETSV